MFLRRIRRRGWECAGEGKRLRPAMCHWGYLASGGEIGRPGHAEMVQAATAFELLHQFALLHDDVMDESDRRRGGLAAHRQAEGWHANAGALGDRATFGRNLAVLLGDLALVQAHRLVATLTAITRAAGMSSASNWWWVSAVT